MFKKLVLLAAFVLPAISLSGCMPVGGRGSSADFATPIVQGYRPATAQPMPTQTAATILPAPTVIALPVSTDPPTSRPTMPPATNMPTAAWKVFTSARHHYVVNYPAEWTITVQTTSPGNDPEYVYMRPAEGGLPQVQVLALKDAPPITGFENCDKNLLLKGVPACSISLPKAQIPATRLLVFQKGESHYHLAMQYEALQQLAVFEEIVKSLQFTP